MPTREIVTQECKDSSVNWIFKLWNELYWCRIDTSLIAFIISLYEIALIVMTPIGMKANHRYLLEYYPSKTMTQLCSLRNLLAHNIYNISSIRTTMIDFLLDITQPVFVDICDTCGLPGSIVWDTLLDMCDKDDTTTREYNTPTLLRLKTMKELIGE